MISSNKRKLLIVPILSPCMSCCVRSIFSSILFFYILRMRGRLLVVSYMCVTRLLAKDTHANIASFDYIGAKSSSANGEQFNYYYLSFHSLYFPLGFFPICFPFFFVQQSRFQTMSESIITKNILQYYTLLLSSYDHYMGFCLNIDMHYGVNNQNLEISLLHMTTVQYIDCATLRVHIQCKPQVGN